MATRVRQAAGLVVLAILIFLGVRLIPIYVHDQQLQRFVAEITRQPASLSASDEVLRSWVLAKAADLDLPVAAGDIRIARAPGVVHMDVRYVVPVSMPFYTVNLHFYPGAGSQ